MTKTDETVILVVDDDEGHLTTLRTIIQSWGYRVDTAGDGALAVEKVRNTIYDLILMDVRMAVMSGLEALKRIKAYNPAIPVLIMTAYSSVASAVEALKTGAYDYLTKPLDFEALKITLERAMEHKMLKAENKALKEKIRSEFDLKSIIGKSGAMKALIDMVAMIAPSDATVLINGESGTGKELIARAIHFNSPRRERPLITVNCAALTETLLASELFGHEKGAFTGAEKRREGRFVQADGGTLFLDEIGEMSPAMQAKLLRVLQDGEVQRVGSDQTLSVDVRIVAATNRDLEMEMAGGNFREDLFYRLNVVNLHVPPVRDRVEDIPLLAQHFLDIYARKNRKDVKGFTPLAMDMLIKYNWPGNVRELENAVERAVIILAGDFITEKELPLAVAQAYGPKGGPSTHPRPAVGTQRLEDMEKMAVLAALEEAGGNKSEAARALGITRRALYNKIEKFGLL